MKKNILFKLCLLSFTLVLISWGGTGHTKINTAAALSFNTEMSQFNVWTAALAQHASDADARKNSDPSEGQKHFIDIDNYAEFVAKGRIPQTLDSAILMHNATFVNNNGTLPWATIDAFNNLQSCFARRDWNQAVLVAADLGHYVADGHMPLHISSNYDGAQTYQKGIHSRYESTMINAYVSQITYTGMPIAVIPDVNKYVFDYIYKDNGYVQAVLAADLYAVNKGVYTTEAYKTALWNQTKDFTTTLFKNASHALTELIYTAWVQAGSPSMVNTSVVSPEAIKSGSLGQNVPNPFGHSTTINYSLTKNSDLLLQVKDLRGKTIATIVNEHKTTGSYSLEWTPVNIPGGIYYLVMKTGESVQVQKMVLLN